LALAEQLYAAAPLNTDLRRIAAYAHLGVGWDLLLMKEPAGAAPHLAKASAEFQSLSTADPKNVQYSVDAVLGLGAEAEGAIGAGQPARAIENLKRAFAILPEPAPQLGDLAVANQFRMGKALRHMGRLGEACPWFERSLPGLLEAQQHHRLYGRDSERIDEAREALRSCRGGL